MSHSIKGNGKHLTFSDRVYIEQELTQQSSFRYIAANLGKDPSTISKEVRLHCVVEPNSKDRFSRCNLCKHFGSCKDTVFICSGCITHNCRNCRTNLNLAKGCKDYNPFLCDKLYKPPYVCNGCPKKKACHESNS